MYAGKYSKLELLELEKKHIQSKEDYYRFVIRNEDKTIMSRLGKIPDNWDNYDNSFGIDLSEIVKSRLSDIKKKKAWEIKLQSLYFFFITNIENKLLSIFQQGPTDEEDLNDAIDSISNLILEIDGELFNIKYMLLTLAKRSISDFYYLLSAYCKFFLKRNFIFEEDIKQLLEEIIKIFKKNNLLQREIENFLKINNEISDLFTKTNTDFGWRINEFYVRDFFEKSSQAVKILELNRVVRTAYEYKKFLLNNYSFLKFYYNENEGKLFRLNFVYESLKLKMDEKKISEEVFNSYKLIRDSFINYKYQFEIVGILGFGSEKISYYDLLYFIFKLCKVMEFYYLRNMNYDALQQLRNDILYYVEKELISLSD